MSLEAILDPEGTQNKQNCTTQGRQTPLTKPKEANVPCYTHPSTRGPSATQGRNGLVGSRASVKELNP